MNTARKEPLLSSISIHLCKTATNACVVDLPGRQQNWFWSKIGSSEGISQSFTMPSIAPRGKKTVMCISPKGNNKLKIYVDGQLVEQVDQFRLGGYCAKELLEQNCDSNNERACSAWHWWCVNMNSRTKRQFSFILLDSSNTKRYKCESHTRCRWKQFFTTLFWSVSSSALQNPSKCSSSLILRKSSSFAACSKRVFYKNIKLV